MRVQQGPSGCCSSCLLILVVCLPLAAWLLTWSAPLCAAIALHLLLLALRCPPCRWTGVWCTWVLWCCSPCLLLLWWALILAVALPWLVVVQHSCCYALSWAVKLDAAAMMRCVVSPLSP